MPNTEEIFAQLERIQRIVDGEPDRYTKYSPDHLFELLGKYTATVLTMKKIYLSPSILYLVYRCLILEIEIHPRGG